MSIKTGAQFEGNLDNLGALHPFRINGRYENESGHALGHDQHGQVRLFDHALARLNKTTAVPFVMILGEIGSGKTTLATKLAKAYAPVKVRGGQRSRIGLDITKRDAGESEYDRFIQFLGSKPIDLANRFSGGINVLDRDMHMSFSEQVKLLQSIAEHGDYKLKPKEKHMLRVGLSLMLNDYDKPHIKTLNDIFATISADQYNTECRRMGTVSEGVNLRLRQRDIDDTGMRLIDLFSNTLYGEEGSIFGGDASLSEVMSQPVVAFDYTGLEPESIPIMQSVLWRFKSSALRREDDRFICDVELHDENYGMWEHMVYASAMHAHIKKLRGRGSLLILITHRTKDYMSIGGRQGKLAANMLNDVAIVALGRHTPDLLPDLKERFGLSDTVLEAITVLRPGQFFIKIGKEQPYLLNVRLTNRERSMTDTDKATRRNTEGG